jgi:beta-barrel assembly-enhancing protease
MKFNSTHMRSSLLLLLLGFFLAWPTVLESRVTPTHGFDLFSAQEEIQAGQEAAGQVSRQLPILPPSDPVTQYIQRLGQELASHAPGEKWPYSFHVVSQKEVNAFALPGGPVYVNVGSIQASDSEAELAGVMAHEISHIVERHGTRQASRQMMAQLPLSFIGALLGRGGALGQLTAMVGSVGVQSIFLRYSRQAESEADLLGTDIMYDTGFDPHALARFFAKLEEQGGSTGPQFLSDHPDPGNRAQALSKELATLPRKTGYRQDSPEFREIKDRVMSMRPLSEREIAEGQPRERPYEAGPDEGVSAPQSDIGPSRAMRTFNHSEFQISYPENWQVFGDQNSSITIAPQRGVSQSAVAYGVMINNFQPEDPNDSLDQAVHNLLSSLRQSNPDLRVIGHDENIRVNAMAGKSVDLIGTSPIADQNGRRVQERDWLVAIRRDDGGLLYLVFVAPDKDFGWLRPAFERMLKSLRLR